MRSRRHSIALLLVGILWSASCRASDLRIEILDYGLYSTGTVFKTEIVSGAPLNSVSNLVLAAHTNRVVAALGTRVGFRYAIHTDGPLPPVLMTVYFAPREVVDPESGVRHLPANIHVTDYPTNSFIGYCFDYDWECVEGEWVFMVGVPGKVYARQAIWVTFAEESNEGSALLEVESQSDQGQKQAPSSGESRP